MHSCTFQTQKTVLSTFKSIKQKFRLNLFLALNKGRTSHCFRDPSIVQSGKYAANAVEYGESATFTAKSLRHDTFLSFYFSISFQFSLLHRIMIPSPLLELLCEFSHPRLYHWWKSFEKHRQQNFIPGFLEWNDIFFNFDKMAWMDGLMEPF